MPEQPLPLQLVVDAVLAVLPPLEQLPERPEAVRPVLAVWALVRQRPAGGQPLLLHRPDERWLRLQRPRVKELVHRQRVEPPEVQLRHQQVAVELRLQRVVAPLLPQQEVQRS